MKDKLIEKQRELIAKIKEFWDIDKIRSIYDLENEIASLEQSISQEDKTAEGILNKYLDATDNGINKELLIRAMQQYASQEVEKAKNELIEKIVDGMINKQDILKSILSVTVVESPSIDATAHKKYHLLKDWLKSL